MNNYGVLAGIKAFKELYTPEYLNKIFKSMYIDQILIRWGYKEKETSYARNWEN